MTQDVTQGVVEIAAKSAPQATVSGLLITGVSLNDWVLIATLLWIAIQAGVFLYEKFWKRDGHTKG